MTAIKGEERPRSVVKIGAAGIAGKAGQRWEAGVGKGAAGEAARVSAGQPGCLCLQRGWRWAGRLVSVAVRKRGMPGSLALLRDPYGFPGTPGKCLKGVFILPLLLMRRMHACPCAGYNLEGPDTALPHNPSSCRPAPTKQLQILFSIPCSSTAFYLTSCPNPPPIIQN